METMRARSLIGLFSVATSFCVPAFVHASTIWSSAAIHPDEVLVYTPSLTNPWYGGTSTSSIIQIGTWSQPDFTTDASTTIHIWARWNGQVSPVLDILMAATDPATNPYDTNQNIIQHPNGDIYRLNVYATSSLQEYVLPTIPAKTLSTGDAVNFWVWFYPSWAAYGADHWLGSNGTLPYVEICEVQCTGNDSSPSIVILGNATTTVEFGSAFIDPGATAHDSIDGDITSAVQVTGSVNTDTLGTTTLTYSVTNSRGLTSSASRTVVVACTHNCVSSVLFLPGIEGSRLYESTGCGKSAEEKLWEPYDGLWSAAWGAGDKKVADLSLNSNGESSCSDIYTKEGDILDSAGGGNIYRSFIDEMNALKSGGTINDWNPVAYDWRLSLPDLLTRGVERNGKIYYEEATDTPYIEQTLRQLAASSKTGKVTIVAHSNGGLVAKALMQKLGATTTAELVDKVIMVAVPQSGAPYAVGALLVGDNAGIYSHGIQIVSNQAARTFSQNSPMAYHLLPSQTYFDSIMYDPAHPVARFEGDGYATERAAYGGVIGTESELDDFLLAKDGGRTQAADGDLSAAKILNPVLVSYATSTHDALDSWTPPAGITVDQIAGWGVDTVAGIDFYSQQSWLLGTQRLYRPIPIEDGDGTVPVPSVFLVTSSTSVKDYWVDLNSYYNATKIKRTHSDLFEVPSLQAFIKNLIENSTSTLPSYIQTTRPLPNDITKKLTYFLHSPLTLQLTDGSGNVTGMSPDGSVTENIPGSTYGEFGEVKYVTLPEGNVYQLTMHGLSSGVFSLDMQERAGDTVTASSTVADVPTTASTTVTMMVPTDVSMLSPMNVDENGDGTIDSVITPKLGDTIVFDRVPPELHLTFSTTTQSLAITGTDDQGPVTLTSTTAQPARFVKKQKGRAEDGRDSHEAVTTTIARDMAGNTTAVSYTTALSYEGSLSIDVLSLAYNGATTTLPETTLTFNWGRSHTGDYKTLESVLHTATTTITARYQSKPDRTIITTSTQTEKRNRRGDEKEHLVHDTREVVPGMVIPYMTTETGNILISH
ncbi:alpha/beta hydrolase [Patescibacteria group bacterium]|nr:alpha/beta hydrolase [Patescibacteria group bacterium]